MLPAKHRLKGRKIFNELFRKGKSFSTEELLMKIANGEEGQPSRFGFAASLKFSKKAVERNQAKRWMREGVREKLAEIQPGYNVVFFINPKFPKEKMSAQLIAEKVENMLKKGKIMR